MFNDQCHREFYSNRDYTKVGGRPQDIEHLESSDAEPSQSNLSIRGGQQQNSERALTTRGRATGSVVSKRVRDDSESEVAGEDGEHSGSSYSDNKKKRKIFSKKRAEAHVTSCFGNLRA